MARIDERIFKQYIDGRDRMTAAEYMRDREVFRQAINDMEDRYNMIEDVRQQYTNLDSAVNQAIGSLGTSIQQFQNDIQVNLNTISGHVQESQAAQEAMNTTISNFNAQLGANVQNALIGILSRITVIDGRLYLDNTLPPGPDPTDPTDPPTQSFGLVGKWFEETVLGEKVFSTHYPGATIETTVTGTTTVNGSFLYTGMGWMEPPLMQVRVNGGVWRSKYLADSVELVTGLDPGAANYIEIAFDGWNQAENLWGNQRKFSFKSLQVGSGTMTYTNTKKNVLFIGDSITAGTHVFANNDAPWANSHTATYAKKLADKMGVNVITSAFPGTKVVDTFTRTNIGQLSANIPVGNMAIHSVVIMMGTNDPTATSSDFIANYKLLIESVRQLYPTQRIYIIGLFSEDVRVRRNEDLAAIATSQGISRVTHISTAQLALSSTGSPSDFTDLHPSNAGTTKIADYIYPKLVADGWENGGGLGPVTPPSSSVPDGNLWTMSGKPASYSALPSGFLGVELPGSYNGSKITYSFQAKSASGQSRIGVYTEYQTDLPLNDGLALTTEFQTFTGTFTVTMPANQTGNQFFLRRMDFDNHTDIAISDIMLRRFDWMPEDAEPEEPGGTPEPGDDDPWLEDESAFNLWALDLNLKEYNPLPSGFGTVTEMPGSYAGSRFRVRFRASSAKGSKVVVYTESMGDLPRQTTTLTSTMTDYDFEFTCNYSQEGNKLYIIRDNHETDNDIVIENISFRRLL